MDFNAIVEALIFASPEPVSSSALARCLRQQEESEAGSAGTGAGTAITAKTVGDAVERLNRLYEEQGRAFRIVAEAGGWRFLSHPDYAPWIERLLPDRKPPRLSPAALETLAIIAYRQPVTKTGIEAIRGVGVDGVLQTVVDRGLVRTVGRASQPGRPALYGTTELFLAHFGLHGLDDLPNVSELRAAGETPGEDPGAERPPDSPQGRKKEHLVLDSEPSRSENRRADEGKRLSRVEAARKLAERREKTAASTHPPLQS